MSHHRESRGREANVHNKSVEKCECNEKNNSRASRSHNRTAAIYYIGNCTPSRPSEILAGRGGDEIFGAKFEPESIKCVQRDR